MQVSYVARMAEAKEIASAIVAVCDSYAQAPSQVTLNTFLARVEQLADLAEDVEVQQTLQVLNA